MKLLIFDDDPAIGRLVARIGEMAGYNATAVNNAQAFQRGVIDDPPGVVMLDLQLGTTNGVEQLRFLADALYRGPLILVSGFDRRVLATTGELAKSFGLHLAGVVAKPVRVEELEKILLRLRFVGQPPTVDRLRAAIGSSELALVFQPIVSRDPRLLRKLEALVRWNDPVLGLVPPDAFVPTAESDPATIAALTDWVIDATIGAYQTLAARGIRVPMGVNISVKNLSDLAWPDQLGQRLKRADMPPDDLFVEVTETSAFLDEGRLMEILTRIRLQGVRLAIDDFGTGYSSLRLLRQMPFTTLKIDRSFTADLTTSRDSWAIVKSCIDLARNMEMDCIVEGVETEETATMLEAMNADQLQGYLFARPMPIEAIPGWLAEWTAGDALVRGAQQDW